MVFIQICSFDKYIHFVSLLFLQLYIHRSGRTARASREGLSVVLVGPEELGSYKKIMKTLNAGMVSGFVVESNSPQIRDI